MLSIRDPIHGFIRADDLEADLINSRPMQRLRGIRQLGFSLYVFPGAEHSRFGHSLGVMHLAGRVYDSLAPKSDGLLDQDPRCPERRAVRAAALLHDIGHAPFSHSAEDLFENGIDHEEMTARLLASPAVYGLFRRLGGSINQEQVLRLLTGGQTPTEKLLHQIVSGELDVDKMDYLLRDSLFCGVRYGSYDLERLLDTIMPLEDPVTGAWSLGVEEGGVHALEALVMARYYMFTQVYFEVRGKVLELHLSEWLRETGTRWPSDPEAFLTEDDSTVTALMRRSDTLHARAVLYRERYPLAFETNEHLSQEEKSKFEALLPGLEEQFGRGKLLVSNSAKDPHRFGSQRVLVRKYDGCLVPMEEASHFIRHLQRIDRYRVYAAPELQREAAEAFQKAWDKDVPGGCP